MGTSLRKLNIFVSCPSDVTKYRDAVYKWSAERRKHYERDQGIFVNVTSFKEVPTGLALDGEQALIDDFYKDQFDIYLGLMAARFGTPTKNFGSGTEQEYLKYAGISNKPISGTISAAEPPE